MGLAITSTEAAKVLIGIGYFRLHVNLDLLKSKFYSYNMCYEYISEEVDRLLESCEKDDDIYRTDLIGLEVYAIDPDGGEEL